MRLAAFVLAAAFALATGLTPSGPDPPAGPAGQDARFAELDHREAIRLEAADALLRRQLTPAEAADRFARLEAEDAAGAGRGRAARRALACAARLAAARPGEYPPGRLAELEAELAAAD